MYRVGNQETFAIFGYKSLILLNRKSFLPRKLFDPLGNKKFPNSFLELCETFRETCRRNRLDFIENLGTHLPVKMHSL